MNSSELVFCGAHTPFYFHSVCALSAVNRERTTYKLGTEWINNTPFQSMEEESNVNLRLAVSIVSKAIIKALIFIVSLCRFT